MNQPLLKSVRVQCSAGRAFEAFTEQVDLWWPPGHRKLSNSRLILEASVGGRFFECNDEGEEFQLGKVLVYEPPNALSFTWALGAIKEPTRVDISFQEEGDETVVQVVHSEDKSQLGDAWPQRAALFTKGWDHVLAALKNFTAS